LNYHYTLPNNPEERSSHVLHGGRLKSRTVRKGKAKNLRLTLKFMEDQLHINRKSIRQILLGDYGQTKVYVKIYHEVRRMISFCRDSEALTENCYVPKIIHPFDSPDLAAAHFP
jgi:hypothetical protein